MKRSSISPARPYPATRSSTVYPLLRRSWWNRHQTDVLLALVLAAFGMWLYEVSR